MLSEIKHILILEPDQSFAMSLMRALNQIGSFTISIVPTVKEACLHLVQGRQDLAFIPVHEGAKIIRSLRAVQSDLRLVLVTPTSDIDIPVTYSGNVQGVLIKSLMDVELPTILENVLDQPLVEPAPEREGKTAAEPELDTAVLISTLQQAKLGRLVQTAVFARGTRLLAYWGELNENEAASVALHVGKNWQTSAFSSRMQFIHLPARAGDMLLYSQHVDDLYLLTMVALPETPLSELRMRGQRMTRKLRQVLTGEAVKQTGLLSDANQAQTPDGRTSYVIVWRALEPLPSFLQIPLRRALERLANANACVLTHIQVQPDLVHMVVTCPPGRDSSWAAYLFKNGSEQTIQQQYGVNASLWETGFYASESTEPLTPAELKLFLEHPQNK